MFHQGIFFRDERVPGGKVDEDCAGHVRLQKSPNHMVVFFQPVVSEGVTVLISDFQVQVKVTFQVQVKI